MAVNSQQVRVVTAAIDPASVATVTTAEQTFTVPGARVGDLVFVNKPTLTAGLGIAGARVSNNNTVAITFVNPTAGGIDAPNETYTFVFISP
jgi:hypothetical protein